MGAASCKEPRLFCVISGHVYQALYEGLHKLPNTVVVRRDTPDFSLTVYIQPGDTDSENKIYDLKKTIYHTFPNARFEVTVEETVEAAQETFYQPSPP